MGSKKRGFTLIELLVVISIIGFLASITAVRLKKAKDQAGIAQAYITEKNIAYAIQLLYEDTGKWPAHRSAINCYTGETDPADFTDWSYEPFESADCELLTGGSPFAPYLDLNLPWYGLTGLDPRNSSQYPGWNGPYLSDSVTVDPWGDEATGKWGYRLDFDLLYDLDNDGTNETYVGILSGGPDGDYYGDPALDGDEIILFICNIDAGQCPDQWIAYP